MTLVSSLSDLPNLKGQVLGVDTETYDPGLMEYGPGWGRNDGRIVGISLATIEHEAWYIPVGHAYDKHQNLDPEAVFAYLSDILSEDTYKVGANCIYDYGWLMHHGVKLGGLWLDVQFAQALIDPTLRSYSLESIAKVWNIPGKLGNELYTWAACRYPGQATAKDQGGNIYRCPPSVVAPYACQDAVLAMKLYQMQQHVLAPRSESRTGLDLEKLFELECKLIPILVKMRMRGMCIDRMAAYDAADELRGLELLQRDQLHALAGFHVNVNASADLAKFFHARGVEFPRTEKGNPSFTADWLAGQSTQEATLVNNIRKITKAQNTFINGLILDKAVGTRIYPSLHPLRGEGGGTVTGRFSSSKPNSQQIPSRDDFLAPIIRGIFVPEDGYTHWCKLDYSQIEYRMFAHYSNDKQLIEAYQDPAADFHELVGTMLGGAIPRKYVKCINFAKLYGAGPTKITAMLKALGGNIDATSFLKLYDEAFPAAKNLMESTAAKAKTLREIRTILGRRTPFNKYVAKGMYGADILNYKEAEALYGYSNVEVAFAYKAVNYLLQGSAADVIKAGIVAADEAGIFERIGYPHALVHDEIALSYHPDLREDFVNLKHIMETTTPLKVPVIMDAELGPNWGNVKDFNLKTGEFV